LPAIEETAIETTEGETAAAIVWTSTPLPTISINVRVLEQLPSVAAKRALVRLSTQTFVGGRSGVTATATPPATTAPITKPIMSLLKVETVCMAFTQSLFSEKNLNGY
jgi:hypothetical protein